MKKLFCGAILVALCVLFSSTASGQAQFTTGTIQGDVIDEKGGSVPGASVEAKNLDTNYARNETTDNDGHFALLNLAPGRYTLTVTKSGFATIVQQNLNLTVGQNISIPVSLRVSAVAQQIVVSDVPVVETTATESSSTLEEAAIAKTPVLGRKFEDLLTLTPGVSISQGPDGDEININGQRGIFNNVSLDGGDYNNGFFGEQVGGQRAAIDITLEAVKEFQIVASGANAEFGRSAGSSINVITKSGTNSFHGSAFEYFRTEGLTAATSDGKPLDNFRRNQFGGSLGGPIAKDKLFFFGAAEGIRESLTRKNLSDPIGAPCSVQDPVFNSTITDAEIEASLDCQRLVLLNFFKNADLSPYDNTDEGLPVDHSVRNASVFGRVDYNLNAKNQIFGSYSFDWSKNPNQTFDVPTYGTSANGTEGPSKIQVVNTNWFSTVSADKLNEAHFTYSREVRPRNTTNPNAVPDTAAGPIFRFGQPYFLEPSIDELFWRTDFRDSFSLIKGKHTFKFGGEWIHSRNPQIFRGFFSGKYMFDTVTGFLHYGSPASLGDGFGPGTVECSNGTFGDIVDGCSGGASIVGGPLFLYLQHGPVSSSQTPDQSGASDITNEDFSLFAQDSWKMFRNFTLNYGLRWDAQHFPDPATPPSQTSYGVYLNDPSFPSNGTLPNQNKEFQPRVGFAWDVTGKGKSVLRASYGIFFARQNMLTQVGSITTNGAQQQSIAAGTFFNTAGGPPPTYPGTVPLAPQTPPLVGAGIQVFSRDYANPRIYTTNVGFEQQLIGDYAAYLDFTMSKGVHLTRFIDPNKGVSTSFDCSTVGPGFINIDPGVCVPSTGGSVTYPSDVFGSGVAKPFPLVGSIDDTVSSVKSLYRGFTIGARKRMSHRFLFDANYTYSKDYDDDSNERDPFTFRYANLFDLAREYGYSDRDERHKFNFYTVASLPGGFDANVRMQAHSAQPTSGARIVNNEVVQRNLLRKDNAFFTFDFGVGRPFRFSDRYSLIPKIEVFNLFNNKNNVNPLIAPSSYSFDGFIRQGVGDPRQAQLSIRFEF